MNRLRVAYLGKPDAGIVLARIEIADSGCWLWTGAMQNQGYGQYGKPPRLAHRISFEAFTGPIPEGLTIDHLCRVRRCVNPDHLEPVTRAENVLRGETSGPQRPQDRVLPGPPIRLGEHLREPEERMAWMSRLQQGACSCSLSEEVMPVNPLRVAYLGNF